MNTQLTVKKMPLVLLGPSANLGQFEYILAAIATGLPDVVSQVFQVIQSGVPVV